MNRPFTCPTRVYSTGDYAAVVATLIAGRPWVLATSQGWIGRSATDDLIRAAGRPYAVIDSICPNPKVSDVLTLAAALPDEAEVVVALGGGSVIDCAKSLVGFAALGRDHGVLMDHLHDGKPLPVFSPRPLIAVPTTSGTGSEVTPWATIWGDDHVKFSFSHPALYPEVAVLDPALCLTMPAEVTLASGLDALSHACEAIWNRNHTPVADQFAAVAIRQLKQNLPLALSAPRDAYARREVQAAALLAGFAMGTTQTALAHSISYPFTARFGMPHGFACSFTLPEVARYNSPTDPSRLRIAADAFGAPLVQFPEAFADWLESLGIATYLERYVAANVADTLGDHLINRSRAANNLRPADGEQARDVVRRSLERFCGASVAAGSRRKRAAETG